MSTSGTSCAVQNSSRFKSISKSCTAKLLLLIGCSWLVACSQAGAIENSEPVGTSEQAIVGGVDDVSDATGNVVVKIRKVNLGKECTGTLITPALVLTAAHCFVGSETSSGMGTTAQNLFVEIRSSRAGLPLVIAEAEAVTTFTSLPLTLPTTGDDVALVRIKLDRARDVTSVNSNDVFVWSSLLELNTRRPSFIIPQRTGSAPNFYFTQPVGFAGWATDPRAVAWSTSTSLFKLDNGVWSVEAAHFARAENGDSGGPLFVDSPSGRDVFAVDSNVTWEYGVYYTRFADITRAAVQQWIAQEAIDTQRSFRWRTFHGKPQPWYGEADYAGPCQPGDTDCDHWFDVTDNCPSIFNPDQFDRDDDGAGDPCDVCSIADEATASNCNVDYELANGLPVIPDACDPVPCAAITPIVRIADTASFPAPPECDGVSVTQHIIQDELRIDGVPPAPLVALATAPNLGTRYLPTKFRYCQPYRSGSIVVDCTRPLVLNDMMIEDDVPADAKRVPTPLSPWQRMTVRRNPADFPSGSPNWISRDDDAGVEFPFPGSKRVVWDYKTDDAYWHRAGADPLGTSATNELCKAASFGGSCLSGYIWSHAETEIGNTTTFVKDVSMNDVELGYHGPDLANHVTPITPDYTLIVRACNSMPELPSDNCGFSPMGCDLDINSFKYRPMDCVTCGATRQFHVDRLQVHFSHDQSDELRGVVAEHLLMTPSDLGLTWDVVESLSGQTGLRFLPAAETSFPQAGEVDAVGFPRDLSDMTVLPQHLVADYQSEGGYRLDTKWGGSAGRSSPSTARNHALNDTAVGLGVYSRTMQGTFLFGIGGPEVWFEPLSGFRYVIGEVGGDAEVLAATITRPQDPVLYAGNPNMAPAFLWTVEEEGGTVRLVVREMTFAVLSATPVVSVVLTDVTSDHRLALATAWDRPNEVLLTVSEQSTGHWGAFLVGNEFDELAMQQAIWFASLVNRPDFPGSTHLFSRVSAEDGGLVIPLVKPDDSMALVRDLFVERVGLSRLDDPLRIIPANLLGYVQ